jgi:hypothetical protein
MYLVRYWKSRWENDGWWEGTFANYQQTVCWIANDEAEANWLARRLTVEYGDNNGNGEDVAFLCESAAPLDKIQVAAVRDSFKAILASKHSDEHRRYVRACKRWSKEMSADLVAEKAAASVANDNKAGSLLIAFLELGAIDGNTTTKEEAVRRAGGPNATLDQYRRAFDTLKAAGFIWSKSGRPSDGKAGNTGLTPEGEKKAKELAAQ